LGTDKWSAVSGGKREGKRKTYQTKEPQFFYDGNEGEQVSDEDMKNRRELPRYILLSSYKR